MCINLIPGYLGNECEVCHHRLYNLCVYFPGLKFQQNNYGWQVLLYFRVELAVQSSTHYCLSSLVAYFVQVMGLTA